MLTFDILNADHAMIRDLNDRLLLPNGRIRLLPSSEYLSIPRDHLRVWCHTTARYLIPTVELIEWLKIEIGDLKAIEIGSGNGDLGYHLGIPETDNYCQTRPEVMYYYMITGQIPTSPCKEVLRLDAIDAIRRFRPDVVIGAWITRKFIPGKDIEGVSEANQYGPKEEDILKKCRKYIHIGNWNVHSRKTLLSKPYEEHSFPWIISRAIDPAKDMILVWDKTR